MSPKLRVEMYYVYLWVRENRTPYYVGKGKKYRAYVKHTWRKRWISPPPKDRIVIVKYFDNEEESYLFEEWLISVYKRKSEGGILINRSIGGRKRNSRVRTESEFKKRQKKTVKKYQQSNKGKETYKKWVVENKERVKEIKKKYYDENREKLNEKKRGCEKRSAANKTYREKNKERISQVQKEYQQKNKERLREYHRQYYQRKKLEAAAYLHTA
jgi:molecular chaperone DnaK (HSP70)